MRSPRHSPNHVPATAPYDPAEDPFVNTTEKLSLYNKFKFLFPGLIFIPLRLVIGIGSLAICSLLCWICLIGAAKTKPASPLVGFRAKCIEYITRGESWLLLFSLGFLHVKVRGKVASRSEAPIVVSNHCAAWEAFALKAVAGVTFLSKGDNRKVPLLGSVMVAMQCLFVERDSAQSRNAVVDEIRRRAKQPGWPQLAIFPEGTAVNQRSLLAFRTGAFQPGVPVQPVIARFPFKHMDPTYTGHKIGLGGLVLRLITQWYNQVELTFLPVYYPSEEEKANPQLFADNVRAVMAKAGAMNVSEYNVEDYFITSHAAKLGIPPRDAVVGMERLRRVLNLGVGDVKETMTLFKDMDLRKKGEITYQDFLNSLGMDDSNALRATFAKMAGHDSDDDGFSKTGKLNFRAFLESMVAHARELTSEGEIRFAFEVINIKGDGKITCDEVAAVMLYLKQGSKAPDAEDDDRAQQLFKKMDTRKAGFVDFLQFGAFTRQNPTWMELFEEVRTTQREMGMNPTLEMLSRRAEGNPMTVAEFRDRVLQWNKSTAFDDKKTQ